MPKRILRSMQASRPPTRAPRKIGDRVSCSLTWSRLMKPLRKIIASSWFRRIKRALWVTSLTAAWPCVLWSSPMISSWTSSMKKKPLVACSTLEQLSELSSRRTSKISRKHSTSFLVWNLRAGLRSRNTAMYSSSKCCSTPFICNTHSAMDVHLHGCSKFVSTCHIPHSCVNCDITCMLQFVISFACKDMWCLVVSEHVWHMCDNIKAFHVLYRWLNYSCKAHLSAYAHHVWSYTYRSCILSHHVWLKCDECLPRAWSFIVHIRAFMVHEC